MPEDYGPATAQCCLEGAGCGQQCSSPPAAGPTPYYLSLGAGDAHGWPAKGEFRCSGLSSS